MDELLPSARKDLRLCFNCGSSDHAVALCPTPFNRQLVSLSRQLFNFLHPDSIKQETIRFYVAEGWREQRLAWLSYYKPGVIRNPLLRDALGLHEGDPGNTVEWLHYMAIWGYPPGWVGSRDPRQLVWSRILEGEMEGHVATAGLDSFTIFEGVDDNDEIDLGLFDLRDSITHSPAVGLLTTSSDIEPTRWATYPDTYFSSMALSVYNGTLLDRVAFSPSRVSITFSPARGALREQIPSGDLGVNDIRSLPPWRAPSASGDRSCSVVGASIEHFIPPPPSTTPPPLPLMPNSPAQTFSPQKLLVPGRAEGIIDVSDESVVDMDMSDGSE